jgi:hypothetical protein
MYVLVCRELLPRTEGSSEMVMITAAGANGFPVKTGKGTRIKPPPPSTTQSTSKGSYSTSNNINYTKGGNHRANYDSCYCGNPNGGDDQHSAMFQRRRFYQ